MGRLAPFVVAVLLPVSAAAAGGCSDRPEAGAAMGSESDASMKASVGTESSDGGSVSDSGLRFLESASLDSLFDDALVAYGDGAYDLARTRLEALRDEADRRADHRLGAMARTWLGYAHWRLGEYEASRRAGEDAVELELRYGLDDLLPRSYNQLGLVAWHQARYGRALELLDTSAKAASAVGSESETLKARGNEAAVRIELGQFREARRLLEERLTVARRDDDTLAIADVLTNLGKLEVAEGRPEAAVAPIREALALYRSGGYATRLENPYAQLGTAFFAMGELGRAHVLFDSALAMAREVNDRPAIAFDTEILAESYWKAGRWQRALELYAEAREENQALGHRLELGSVLRSEAAIHASLGHLAEAQRRIERALDIHQAIGARWETTRDRILLADVLAAQERWEPAAALVDTVAAEAGELDTRATRVAAGLAAARLADARGEPSAVLAALGPLSDDLRRSGFEEEWEAARLEARARRRSGDLEGAVMAGARAIEAIGRMHSGFRSGQLRTSFVAARRDTYAMQVETLLRLGRIADAFAIADAARGGPSAETGVEPAGAGAEDRDDAEAAGLLRRIEALVAAADVAEAATFEDGLERSEELADLRQQLARVRGAYEARLITLAEGRGGAPVARGTPDASAIRASLEPGEALLEYLLTADRLLVFVVTGQSITVAESDVASSDLRGRTRLLRQLVGDPATPLARLDPVLERLHTDLVEPALRTGRLAGIQKLVIVPHQWLTYVPFAALRDPGTGRRLVESYDLRLLPNGTRITGEKAQASAGRPGRPVGIAAFAPFPEQLPASREEARAVTAVLRPGELRLGREASEAAVRRSLAERRIVHVATHGRLNPLNPLFSRLDLARLEAGNPADDGRLEVHELRNLHVAADLVVLSGCETALGRAGYGRFAPGDDYMTLASGFLRAGAASVVATLWSVDDHAAAVLARRFYDMLLTQSDGDVAAALAAAQQSMATEGQFAHPYYWAGYVLTGRRR